MKSFHHKSYTLTLNKFFFFLRLILINNVLTAIFFNLPLSSLILPLANVKAQVRLHSAPLPPFNQEGLDGAEENGVNVENDFDLGSESGSESGFDADSNSDSDSDSGHHRGNFLVLDAAREGREGDLKRILNNVSPEVRIKMINQTERFLKNTPLHFAVINGDSDSAKLLIDLGARKDTLNSLGESALTLAVKQRDYEMVQFLVEQGKFSVDPLGPGHGKSPALWAATNGDWNILAYLFQQGADLTFQDDLGRHAYIFAAMGRDEGPYNQSDIIKVLEFLKENAPQINMGERDADTRTALYYAAEQGFLEVVKWLVENEMASENKWANIRQATIVAKRNKKREVVKYLSNQERLRRQQVTLREGIEVIGNGGSASGVNSTGTAPNCD